MDTLNNHLCSITENKIGLEIGGPSYSGWAIYSNAVSMDNAIFSKNTVWSVHDTEYKYFQGKTGKVIINDATMLTDIKSGIYDFVFASHTLEHIANPLKALSEWLRVTKDEGHIILILPEKSVCFDHRRQVSSFDRLVKQYINNVQEDDLSTLPEILSNHDLSLDPPAGNFEQFTRRSLNNYDNRCLHHYVYSPDLLKQICHHMRCEFVYTVTNGLDIWFIMKKLSAEDIKSTVRIVNFTNLTE